jgi:hypothetical protein
MEGHWRGHPSAVHALLTLAARAAPPGLVRPLQQGVVADKGERAPAPRQRLRRTAEAVHADTKLVVRFRRSLRRKAVPSNQRVGG